MKISNDIFYVGVSDKTIDLFESQYPVPDGVTYNSYVILDEKTAVMDTVDARATDDWFRNLDAVLGERKPDYLVVSHMEPDHAANVARFAEKYPDAQIVCSAKAVAMISQFFGLDITGRSLVVKEGDTLNLGAHTLTFVMAPMVHWPEVMVSYEQSEKILFSADGFGTFGTWGMENGTECSQTEIRDSWKDEAARYFLNIVGKYGAQVQALLKKASTLDIRTICPLHGPVLREDLGYYIGLYDTWSSYRPEKEGVLVAFASIHGNTARAAAQMERMLCEKGVKTELIDLARTDVSVAVRKAFAYDRMVLAAATYDGGIFPCMEEFLHHLKSKNFQKRTVGVMENGTWAPICGKQMKELLGGMKEITVVEPMVTIRSAVNEASLKQMEELAAALAGNN